MKPAKRQSSRAKLKIKKILHTYQHDLETMEFLHINMEICSVFPVLVLCQCRHLVLLSITPELLINRYKFALLVGQLNLISL